MKKSEKRNDEYHSKKNLESKKTSISQNISKKNRHEFKKTNPFFIIDKNSIKEMEDGSDNIELILNFCEKSPKILTEAVEELRVGSLEEIKGEITFKFPQKYIDLIAQRRREGIIKKLVLIKKNKKEIIDLTSLEKELKSNCEKSSVEKPSRVEIDQNNKYQQVLCIIQDFPGIEKKEHAFLTFIDENIENVSYPMSYPLNDKKIIQLYHFTPWNIDKEKFNDILQHQRLVVYVKSNNNARIYLTKDCQKNIMENKISGFVVPYYATKEQLKKAFPEDSISGEKAFLIININEMQTFSLEQYNSAYKMSLVALTYEQEIGNNYLLPGGVFYSTNPNLPTTNVNTIGTKHDDGLISLFFFLTSKGLENIENGKKIIQLEVINSHTISQAQNWHDIINESKLVILQEKGGNQNLLIHEKFLKESLFWQKKLEKDLLSPIAVHDGDKFIPYLSNVNLRFINQAEYENIVLFIEKLIERR